MFVGYLHSFEREFTNAVELNIAVILFKSFLDKIICYDISLEVFI